MAYEGAFHALGVSGPEANALSRAGYHTDAAVLAASDDDLRAVVGDTGLQRIRATSAGGNPWGVTDDQLKSLHAAGYDNEDKIRNAPDDDLLAVDGIGRASLQKLRAAVG